MRGGATHLGGVPYEPTLEPLRTAKTIYAYDAKLASMPDEREISPGLLRSELTIRHAQL